MSTDSGGLDLIYNALNNKDKQSNIGNELILRALNKDKEDIEIEIIKDKKEIENRQEIKPNKPSKERIYKIDRRTIEKYNNGYCRENIKIIRKSKLDNLKNEIKEKLELPGITITGLYQYFSKDNNIGTYSNFYKYINKHKLKPKKIIRKIKMLIEK